MSHSATRPLIGVSACLRTVDGWPVHGVVEKYIAAVVDAAGGQPLLIPAIGAGNDLPTLLGALDGLLLTGSLSNVEPRHYDGPASRPDVLHDAPRDATTLPLIRSAIAEGLPLLAVCRGLQELNVALGGSLHQHLEEVGGRLDHRSDATRPTAEQYGPAHPVALAPGGLLARLAGRGEAMVNSLHGQGIDRLAPGLAVEATAPDGTVEAVRVAQAPAFALGVQWHPEWQVLDDPLSAAIFSAFGHAAAQCAQRRTMHARPGKVA